MPFVKAARIIEPDSLSENIDEVYNSKFYQPLLNQYWKILNSKFLD